MPIRGKQVRSSNSQLEETKVSPSPKNVHDVLVMNKKRQKKTNQFKDKQGQFASEVRGIASFIKGSTIPNKKDEKSESADSDYQLEGGEPEESD